MYCIGIINYCLYEYTPKLTLENIEFVSEEKALVSMDYEIYVDLNKKQYFVQEGTGYVLNDSESYYEDQTMDDVFANGKKADIHIIKSDEY